MLGGFDSLAMKKGNSVLDFLKKAANLTEVDHHGVWPFLPAVADLPGTIAGFTFPKLYFCLHLGYLEKSIYDLICDKCQTQIFIHNVAYLFLSCISNSTNGGLVFLK